MSLVQLCREERRERARAHELLVVAVAVALARGWRRSGRRRIGARSVLAGRDGRHSHRRWRSGCVRVTLGYGYG